ncbi:helix-turn-helix domain-containing protein [Marinoscillum sp.]|uniref:helix-turn-helix transcriptional regulator n=1 Tax=Marinoscillum sp. TaxID=2024838 RepID=UPI003BA9D9D1
MPFVSSSIYHKAKKLALSEGLDATVFDGHNGSSELQGGAKYIPIDLLFDTYEAADAQLAPGFAVRQGKQLDSDDYGTLGMSWKTSWQARDVFDRLVRFMVLVTDHGSIKLEEQQGCTSINLDRPAHRRGVEIANEVSLVMLTNILHEITGQAIRPMEVCYQHSPANPAAFEDFFQCDVRFNQPVSSLKFKTSDLSIQTLKADRTINAYLLERMDEEKRGIHANSDQLIGEIHQLIEQALPSGIPSLVQVSEFLGMSPRTLKRRLSEKGISFREYVQKIQKEVAMTLIRNTSQSMAEIAFQTGFSEQSAFNRAFKRWTDQSPADYRKNL